MTTELQTLERELAYSAARADIECHHCLWQNHSGKYHGRWYDTAPLSGEDSEWVAKSIRYLELRKLLRRHPENGNLVQVLEDEK